MRFQEAPLVEKFDPDSDGYDYQTSEDIGIQSSPLDPRTGMVLRGRNHPEWDLMVEEEVNKGNVLIKADDGRYYSIKKQRFMGAPVLEPAGNVDTPETVSENAKMDYDFAVENNVTLGFIDTMKEEWATSSNLQKKIPFYGGYYAINEKLEIYSAAKRLEEDRYDLFLDANWSSQQDLYPKIWYPEDKRGFELEAKEQFKIYTRDQDRKIVASYLKYLAQDRTIMGKIAQGVSVLPTWMIEFAATGWLARLGDSAAKKAGEKIIGEYAKTKVGQIALKTAGWAAGGVTRTAGLLHRVGDTTMQRQVDVVLGLREDENWATSALIGWGDVAIEAATETAGEGMTAVGGALIGKLKFGSKLTSMLESAWITATGGTKGEFVRKMASKAGYSNILGEIGEERLGTILRAITSVDDFGAGKDATIIERLQAGIISDYENMLVEIGVLAAPMAGQFVLSKVLPTPEGGFNDKIDELLSDAVKTPSLEELDAVLGIKEDGKEVVASVPEPTEPSGEPREVISGIEGDKTIKPIVKQVEEVEKPVTIESANTAKEIDQIVKQIVRNRIDVSRTSARQSDVNEDRVMLGLDGIASTERRGWQAALQSALEQGIPDNALRIASSINDTPRALSDIDTAGLVIKAARLKNEHKELVDRVEKLENREEIQSVESQLEAIEGEFDTVTLALYKSGTEKGRALASQKLTLNQDYSLISMKNRAKARKGAPLTADENKKLEQISKELELANERIRLLQKQIDEKSVRNIAKEGGIRRYGRMNKAEINNELSVLIARTKQIIEEGCLN